MAQSSKSNSTDPEVWNRLNVSLFIKLLEQCCKSGTNPLNITYPQSYLGTQEIPENCADSAS